jgi:hypothetical protein
MRELKKYSNFSDLKSSPNSQTSPGVPISLKHLNGFKALQTEIANAIRTWENTLE